MGNVKESALKHPLFIGITCVLFGAIFSPVIGRPIEQRLKARESKTEQEVDFEQNLKMMSTDLSEHGMHDFVERARKFRRDMDSDQVPAPFLMMTYDRSVNGDLAGIAKGLQDNVATYLEDCVDHSESSTSAAQHELDCQYEILPLVKDSLETLESRISLERIYGKGELFEKD